MGRDDRDHKSSRSGRRSSDGRKESTSSHRLSSKKRSDDDHDGDSKDRHKHRSSSKHRSKDDKYSDDDSRDRKRKRDKRDRHHRSSRRHDDDHSEGDSKRRSNSHRRDKKRKRSRRDDYSDDDSKDRRHRKEKRHDKKDKKKKDKESRSSKRKDNKSSKDEVASSRGPKINPPDKSKLYPMSAVLGSRPDTQIDPVKDYFTYHEHFWVYLYRNEGIAFNDLTSEQSRKAFERFASSYNAGNLEGEFYTSKLPAPVLEECKTTKHSWGFNTNMTDAEKKGLQTLQQNITKQTEYNNKAELPKSSAKSGYCQPATTAMKPATGQDTDNNAGPTSKTPAERLDERRANKRLRDHVRNVNEELDGGPKDFRERQLAKKREKADKIHGAARDKGEEATEISDRDLYGGADNTEGFQAALAREKARKERRTQARESRITELQQKEKDKQENMLKMLGLQNVKPGQKITIAPRKEG